MPVKNRFHHVLAVGSILIALHAAPVMNAHAQSPVSAEQLLNERTSVSGTIQYTLSTKMVRKSLKEVAAIESFYLSRNYEPYWVRKSGVRSNAKDLVEILEQSWQHGLNPYSYHLKNIHNLIGSRDEAQLADLDVLLTDAFVRLGQDLSGIRVDPRFMKSHKRYWKAPFTGEYLLERLDQQRNVERLVKSLEPRGQTYKRLQKELVQLVDTQPEAYEAVLPIRTRSRVVYPNNRDRAIPDIRTRLGVEALPGVDPLLYDDRLAGAVIRFQRDNNVKDDGIIGAQTLDLLNRSRAQKIEQLIANLERLRWVEEDKPDKFVVVNVPSAMLWAVEDGRVAFEMDVIVGRKKRPTNIFRTEIHGVRLNPDWTVPPTIKKDDILPKLQEDPEYLTNKGMQLISGYGDEAMTLDPLAFDWNSITEEELTGLRMVQIPGRHNPLGEIRVLMPNGYNIYLHDTNERHYFERANRAASSGCVRMKDPVRMANFILQERSGWGDDSLEQLLGGEKTRDIFIENTIPVYLLYYTVWANTAGELVYGRDLYEFDKNLIKMLRDIDGIFIPVDNT